MQRTNSRLGRLVSLRTIEGWGGGGWFARTEVSRFINYFIKCAVGTSRKLELKVVRTLFSFSCLVFAFTRRSPSSRTKSRVSCYGCGFSSTLCLSLFFGPSSWPLIRTSLARSATSWSLSPSSVLFSLSGLFLVSLSLFPGTVLFAFVEEKDRQQTG